MNRVVLNELKKNPKYLAYLRENSYWYPILNRNPIYLKAFKEKMKEVYHERISDKASNLVNSMTTINEILDFLK